MKPNIFYQLIISFLMLTANLVWAQQNNYCNASGSNSVYMSLKSESVGSASIGATIAGYTDKTATSTDVPLGALLPFSFATTAVPNTNLNYRIFVDLNQDGNFTNDELIYSSGPTLSQNIISSATFPASAKIGKTRMRVINSLGSNTSACGDIGAGQVVDYTVNVVKPPYCNGSFYSSYYAGISEVEFLNIDNTAGSTSPGTYPSYSDFTGLNSTPVIPGSSFPIKVSSGTTSGATVYITVYLDSNNNGIFEDSEKTYLGKWLAVDGNTYQPLSGSISVPLGSTPGKVRMRVIQSLEPIEKPCDLIGNNGEVEDYTITIACTPPAPNTLANFICPSTASVGVINPSSTLTYTWYNAANGGIVLGTGANYSTTISTSTSFFVDAKNAQGCVSTRVPASVTYNQCCASNSKNYSVSPTKSLYITKDDLTLQLTNNKTIAQTLTLSLVGGFSTATPSKTVTLQPGQSTVISFVGDFPIVGGSYVQTVTVKDASCSFSYTLPINVSIVNASAAVNVQLTAINQWIMNNATPSQAVSYYVRDPYGATVLTGSIAAYSSATLNLTNSSYALGKYQIFTSVASSSTGSVVIHKQ